MHKPQRLLATVALSCALAPVAFAQATPPTGPKPDILDNASFEAGYDRFTNGAGGAPTSVRDSTLAADGAWSLKYAWTPNPANDVGSNTFFDFPGQDHVWVRFYIRLTAPITSIMKLMRFDSANGRNTHLGGLFMGQGSALSFGSDQENGAAQTSFGLQPAQLVDGKWHWIEIEYWRNGDPSGVPTVGVWFDGTQLGEYDGQRGVAYPREMHAHWTFKRLNVGSRGSFEKLGAIEWMSTLNQGNRTSGQINIDKVSVSSKGPIGP
jgi:hypothetical protein